MALQQFFFHQVKNGQRYSKHHFVAFDEEEIPQALQHIEVEAVGEDSREPLQSRHACHVKVFLEVSMKTWQSLLDEGFHYLLVNSRPDHILEVVHWHEILYDASEDPEGFFLGHDLQQSSNDEVEALTVADV